MKSDLGLIPPPVSLRRSAPARDPPRTSFVPKQRRNTLQAIFVFKNKKKANLLFFNKIWLQKNQRAKISFLFYKKQKKFILEFSPKDWRKDISAAPPKRSKNKKNKKRERNLFYKRNKTEFFLLLFNFYLG